MTTMHEQIHLNQIGYRPSDAKTVYVHGQDGPFEVIDASQNSVLRGTLSGPIEDPASGDAVYQGDLSPLAEGGPYTVVVPGLGHSAPFTVSETVYRNVQNAMMKFFYFQRCGMELSAKHAGVWAHKACHTAFGTVYDNPSERLPSAGGWHDAGDYGKYTVAAAKAIADLLLAFECFPASFADELNIPESGNGVPDILNEVGYELEWLFQMQRAADGAVFHKLTTKQFCGLSVMPEDDTAELVFSPISYTATATFVAAMAMAARVYRPFDRAFSDRCLAAAKQSWTWLTGSPDMSGFHNPPDIGTGEYGDGGVMDERYWAAAEMYRTTGDRAYHDAFVQTWKQGGFSRVELGWAAVGGYGTVAYLLTDPSLTQPQVRTQLLTEWDEEAKRLIAQSRSDGYGITLKPEEYIWGSTMVLLNQAMHLIFADRFSERAECLRVAHRNFDYLLGNNPLNQCYVSGFGTKPLMHPHHRPSVGDGIVDPVPGMVSGGPNKNLQDDIAREKLTGQTPARSFIDHIDSYSTNEVTIYWNSPAVFVAACFTA